MHIVAFVILGCLTSNILAGGLPNGFERVWLWYAYSLDCQRPVAERVMKDCVSIVGGGPCYFTEFMEVVDGQPRGTYWNTPTSHYLQDPYQLNPDPAATAQRIFNAGWTQDFRPNNFMRATQQNGYIGMIEDVSGIFGDCRKDGAFLQRNQGIFDLADESLRQAVGYRGKAWSDFLISDAKQNLRGIKMTEVNSEFGRVFDFFATISNSDNAGITDLNNKVSNFVATKHSAIDASAESHWKVMSAMNDARDVASGNCR
ncbi:hypothetical protein VTL71DRAFT_9480 [Oculimacula yallundae]|uniref:Uncharacterized protein n=1 Tax=Oculimacula yallundae TaxID=86028 RepID=A0ABR4BS15_9HELO